MQVRRELWRHGSRLTCFVHLQFLRKIFESYLGKKQQFLANILYLWHLIQWVLCTIVTYPAVNHHVSVIDNNIKFTRYVKKTSYYCDAYGYGGSCC